MRAVNKWASALKIILGVVFLISAASKLVTIDSFEMYVYSFGLFPMVVCFYFSRLLIAAELLLGVALISHRNHRFTTLMSLLFLIFFVVFLVYAQLIGRTDSCHCFGDLLPFNPVQSILKNAVMILMLLFVYKYGNHEWHPRWWLIVIVFVVTGVVFFFFTIKILHSFDYYSFVLLLVGMVMGILASLPFYSRWWMTVPLILAPFVTTFILSPPDSWYFKEGNARFDSELFSSQMHRDFDEAELEADAEGETLDTVAVLSRIGLDQGRHLVAFFSPTCGYCRLAAEKISTIATRKGIDGEKIVYVFPGGFKEEKYEAFYEHANTCRYEEARIDQELFVRITRASFPAVVFVEDGNIVATYAYRNINEEEISNFLAE